MKLKFIFPAIIVILILSSVSACSSSAAAEPTATPSAVVDSGGVSAEGRVEPVRFAQLALSASGQVNDVLVSEGDPVEPGQVIARLDTSQAKTLESAQADATRELTDAYQVVRDAQYRLDQYDVPSEFKGMTAVEAVKSTLDKLNTARANFEPYKNFSDRKIKIFNTTIDTGIYHDTAKVYKKRLDEAWADYRQAVRWLGLESDLDSAQARLAQAQKNADSLQDASFSEDTAGVRAALANAELRAPFAGTVTNLDLKVGEFAAAGQPVVTVADLSSWVVKTTDLTEVDVVNIKEGQLVTLTLDAVPGMTFDGTVQGVSLNYTEKQGDIVYEVTVLLADHDPVLRWGMTAQVKFEK